MINYSHSVLSLCVQIIVFMLSLLVLLMLLIFYIFLTLHIFSFCPLILCFCLVDIKTQELTTYVFILPFSVHRFAPPPPPPPTIFFFVFFLFHCVLQSGSVYKFAPQELVTGLQCLPTQRFTWRLCTRGGGGGGIGVL